MKLKVLAILSVITMIPALYMIFLFAPTEKTQGMAQRIFYIHVPLAVIGAYGSALLLFIGCLGFLLTRDLKWDRFAAAAAEMGVVFTAAQLLTAMMWAKPIWGTWYVFDYRGTLQIVLLLIFIAYFMLRSYLPDREKRAKLCGVFGLLGMVDVPINYLSIFVSNPTPSTGHQPWRRRYRDRYGEDASDVVYRHHRFVHLRLRAAPDYREARRGSRLLYAGCIST
jgi:heme exporter protein C